MAGTPQRGRPILSPLPGPKEATLPNGQKIELSLDNPLFADFERMPATFEQFISDPYYFGKTWKNPFPAWRQAGNDMFPLPLRSPYSALILLGATGIGKSCINGTKVLTIDGYVPIEQLKVGDLVASNDGKFYPVTGVFPQGKQPVYEFEFNYGVKCCASDNHIWTISRDYGKTYHDETTKEIIENGIDGVELPEVQKIEKYVEEVKKYELQNIAYAGEEECTCISVAAPNKLFLIEHAIPTHNTSFSVNMIAAYFLHIVLCLRNPHEYFDLEEQKNIVFAFLNIVTKTIAYKNAWGMFHKALLQSDFFMEYGYKTQGNKPEWVCNKKPVELLYGSTADQIIGLDILFCLTGDTAIKTSKGFKKLEDLVGKKIQVETFNPETGAIERSAYCTVLNTKMVTELLVIEFENGSTIRCTPEHKFLLTTGVYKRADELQAGDDIQEG